MTPEERIARLETHVEHQADTLDRLRGEIESLRRSIDALVGQAARWKGAFGVLLAVGGVLGTVGTLVGQWLLRKMG